MSSAPSHAEVPGPEVGRWLLERLVAEGVRHRNTVARRKSQAAKLAAGASEK